MFDHNALEEPYNQLVEEYDETDDIEELILKVNEYNNKKKQTGRNVSSLMQTVGADELIGSKRWPNRNMANFQKRIPKNALSEISSFLSGVPRKTYSNQQKILHERITRIPGAPGAGIGGRRTIKF